MLLKWYLICFSFVYAGLFVQCVVKRHLVGLIHATLTYLLIPHDYQLQLRFFLSLSNFVTTLCFCCTLGYPLPPGLPRPWLQQEGISWTFAPESKAHILL